MPPAALQNLVRATIDQTLDRKLFNRELATERTDAAEVATLRMAVAEALKKYG